jgi:hypothetical protein
LFTENIRFLVSNHNKFFFFSQYFSFKRLVSASRKKRLKACIVDKYMLQWQSNAWEI